MNKVTDAAEGPSAAEPSSPRRAKKPKTLAPELTGEQPAAEPMAQAAPMETTPQAAGGRPLAPKQAEPSGRPGRAPRSDRRGKAAPKAAPAVAGGSRGGRRAAPLSSPTAEEPTARAAREAAAPKEKAVRERQRAQKAMKNSAYFTRKASPDAPWSFDLAHVLVFACSSQGRTLEILRLACITRGGAADSGAGWGGLAPGKGMLATGRTPSEPWCQLVLLGGQGSTTVGDRCSQWGGTLDSDVLPGTSTAVGGRCSQWGVAVVSDRTAQRSPTAVLLGGGAEYTHPHWVLLDGGPAPQLPPPLLEPGSADLPGRLASWPAAQADLLLRWAVQLRTHAVTREVVHLPNDQCKGAFVDLLACALEAIVLSMRHRLALCRPHA